MPKNPIRYSSRTFQHLDNARMNCFTHKKSLQLLVWEKMKQFLFGSKSIIYDIIYIISTHPFTFKRKTNHLKKEKWFTAFCIFFSAKLSAYVTYTTILNSFVQRHLDLCDSINQFITWIAATILKDIKKTFNEEEDLLCSYLFFTLENVLTTRRNQICK